MYTSVCVVPDCHRNISPLLLIELIDYSWWVHLAAFLLICCCCCCCLHGCSSECTESTDWAVWAIAWPWLASVCCRSSLTGVQADRHTVRPLWCCTLLAFWNTDLTDWPLYYLSNPRARVDERGQLSRRPTSTYWDWMMSSSRSTRRTAANTLHKIMEGEHERQNGANALARQHINKKTGNSSWTCGSVWSCLTRQFSPVKVSVLWRHLLQNTSCTVISTFIQLHAK